ncbi:hypothetical protein SEVIR_2G369200v4 [Setaria viridis]|uniref:Uncharacterized protein n=1 Tax=Setaria viridis TaxID=4556 RepID=A0A4U6VZA8_SETVI|nr:uncharacterized protein LOC117844676 [Setaria viridis]TKW35401.1 hypothetical protein SEVIR_2G369200v2 [Setaria viridis]
MAASGSGGNGPGGRPWTATSTWAPAPDGGVVEDAISFETSDEDAEDSPAGVLLSRPLPDGDGNAPPCEITVSFRGKYEIHWVYVRSTARIYELYHSTDAKGTSKDYLCTVRCGLAAKEPQPCGEESMSQGSGGAPTSDKREHETKSVSSSSDEDSWVDVKIPESPMGNNTPEAQERNTIRICQENTLAHYEATAEMTDVSPCVSLTIRLLSLQSKTSVHIEEICIFADPVESTNDNSVTGPGNMGGSSLLAMLVPGLMQMPKSRNLKIDDSYFSDGSRTQLTQDRAMKESNPSVKIMQETGLSSTDNYKPSGIESGINSADSGIVSNEKRNQGDLQLKDHSLPLPVQTTESTQVPSVKDQRASDADHLVNPFANEKFTPHNHNLERKMDILLTKVEKMELYCSRFEDSMIKPLSSIDARLQRLEEQFSSFSVEIQSLRGSSAVRSASDSMSNTTNSQEEAHDYANDRTPAPITDRKPGLAVRAPDFSSDDSCCYNVTSENQFDFRGPNVVPRLLVKVPDFIAQPGGNLHDGPSSPVSVYCAPSSEKERKISPGLVVKVPEFPDDDDDDDKVEEEKEAEVGDHDDFNAQYDDTLSKSIGDNTKSKKPVSINGALASALEALLTSTKGTSSSTPVVCTASDLSAENTNDSVSCSLSPEKMDEMSAKDRSADQYLGTSGNANLVGTFRSSQEINVTPHTSLSKEMLDGKVQINEQNDNLNEEKVPFVANSELLDIPSQPDRVLQSIDNGSQVDGQDNCPSFDTMPYAISTGPLVPPQPPTVFEAVDNGVQVNENRPAISLAEFLAARNASSGKNVTSEVCSGNDGAKKLSFERTSADKNSKNISQLLVKKALEVDADEGKHFSSVSIGANFAGSSSVPPGNAASGHNIITKEDVSDKSCGLKNAESGFRLSVGMDSIFSQYHATDSKKDWIENSSSVWSPDDSFSKPNVMHSWSDFSSMESFSGAPAKGPVVSANATSGNYVEDLEDNGDRPTATRISGEEIQKVCDLLYEFKDDMLGMTSMAKGTCKSSPSLEVLLAESSDSEAQISDPEYIDNGAGIGSARLFRTFSSSDDDASTGNEPLVDVADLTTPSEPYASAKPLVDLADLTNPSGTDASAVNELSADVVDLPTPSETCL